MYREYRDKYHWSVIPLKSDGSKTPAVRAWKDYQVRLPNDQEVEKWGNQYDAEREFPQIAVLTGAISNLVVLDIDSETEWDAIDGFPMPKTVQVWTIEPWPLGKKNQCPRGKAHFYFKHPGPEWHVTGRINIKALGGADIRGDGNYVVAPPSRHVPEPQLRPSLPSGWDYCWAKDCAPHEAEVALLPEWLKDRIGIIRVGDPDTWQESRATVAISEGDLLPPPNLHWLGEAFLGVPEGSRNVIATKIAGYFLRLKLPRDHVLSILEAWNTRNTPPLPRKDLKKIVQSIGQAEDRKPAAVAVVPVVIDPEVPLKEQRPGILDGINRALELSDGNKITTIQKFKGENPDYTFIFASGGEAIMSAAQLLSQNQARVAFLGHADKVIPHIGSKKDPNAWNTLVELIDKAAEIVNVGRDATHKGALSGALERYLANHPPDAVDQKDPAPEDEPFIYKGRLHIFIHSLTKYLFMNQFQRLTIQQLARLLKSLGWDTVHLRFGNTRLRSWQAPVGYELPAKEPRRRPEPGNVIPFQAPDVT